MPDENGRCVLAVESVDGNRRVVFKQRPDEYEFELLNYLKEDGQRLLMSCAADYYKRYFRHAT